MVVIDDNHNGWRHLILPLAWMDKLVMKTVLAVSPFHISRRSGGQYDHQTKRLAILSIIVLLAAVMVTGCSDFPVLFHLLQSALDTVGGEDRLGPDELSEFALRQIHKMRVYAAPFISQQTGVYTILSQAPHSFDCLYYSSRFHPDKHLEPFPEGFPGDHSLIWTSFITASESCSPEDQQFFKQFLLKQYYRNWFGDILKGLDLLKRIWARDVDVNWSALLPEPRVFIM
ncbi:uncharacterized protein ASPGLDRAFT_70122 [Aspergillus glaucus CBS 516.65]|uniref:Uncharacterized protein n=1 Tax=Aspergillus glaucus CBS 516.65 TaxID=1160497 RepID=A0A1L9V688_ASPGL|nr:hypothetical protein ASPGLDRAFT_70122 [Aspergillus glaucus CBS 516.65]OJJ79401.1 hypothetical protein ASPGLDRAFT_70122 [Aspergillus glaucus CBS 516.65]